MSAPGNLNVGTVTVTLRALTTGFQQGLQRAGGALQALQRQASSIAASFRFIGGALAIGGITAGVAAIADFEDGLAALRGALSADIRESAKLEKNVQLLGLGIRGLALDSRFTATEITQAAVAFTRAGFSARQTFESLEAVINLAQSEDFSIKDAADISINILKGLRLQADEFARVVDIIVNAGLQANVTVQELGTAFTFAAAVGREFDQSAEEIATSLALLGDNALKGSLGGTSLRQIFIFLRKDFEKSNSVLKSLNIDLFETAKVGDVVTQKFRPLSQILQELNQKAGTADFIRIFQARALTGALALAGTTAEEFARLVAKTAELGSAQRLASFRADTLKGSLFRLKSAVTELFLSLGEAGLSKEIRAAADGFGAFVRGLTNLNPKFLELISAIVVGAGKIVLIGGAFIALAGAASAVLSPIGQLLLGIVGINQALGEGPSLINRFGPQLGQLKDLFLAFAASVGADIGVALLQGFSRFVIALRDAFAGDSIFGFDVSSVFQKINTAIQSVGGELVIFSAEQKILIEDTIKAAQVFGKLAIAADQLDAGPLKGLTDEAKALASQAIAQAIKKFEEASDALEKFTEGATSAVPEVRELAANLRGEEFAEARAEIEKLADGLGNVERAISIIQKSGTPFEIFSKGADILQEQLDALTKTQIGDFAFETEQLTLQLLGLQETLRQIGTGEALLFADQLDEVIKKFGEARQKLEDQVKVEFGRGINDGIRDLVKGIVQGTREAASATDILKGILLSEFTSLFDQILAEKFKFDVTFEKNFEGLGEIVKDFLRSAGSAVRNFFSNGGGQAVGNAFSSIVSGIAGAFGGGSAFSAVAMASGGIATSPTFALIGEAGDEAVIPLDRLSSIMGAGRTEINVFNSAVPPEEIQVREARSNMDTLANIFVGKAAENIAKGGVLKQAIAGQFRVRDRVER